MTRGTWIGLGIVVVLGLLGAAWYYVFDGAVPDDRSYKLDIAAWRELVRDDQAQLPSDIRVEFVGRDLVPLPAVQAGGAWVPYTMARTAFQVNGAVGGVVIDSGMDKDIARGLQREGQSNYDEKAYGRVIAAMGSAARVAVTHEHPDHIGGVARFPMPERLAERLTLTRAQFDGLGKFATSAAQTDALAKAQILDLAAPARIAPGIVMIPAAGHTPGSVMFYVRGWGGREFLFVGDVAWAMSNIRDPGLRPRFVQDFFMSPPEDRGKVAAEIRALHELAKAEPALIIVPSHDDGRLSALIEQGVIRERFIIDAP